MTAHSSITAQPGRKSLAGRLVALALGCCLALPTAAEVLTIGIGTQNTTTNTVTGGIVLKELNSDYTLEQIKEATEAELIISPDLKAMD